MKLVASFTDAWIETPSFIKFNIADMSHLLQMRGLKQCIGNVLCTSHIVASFTDAWIETAGINNGFKHYFGRIFYRCVD